MRCRLLFALPAVAFLLAAAPAHAQTVPDAEWLKCGAISDSLQRLSCFDGLVGTIGKSSAAPPRDLKEWIIAICAAMDSPPCRTAGLKALSEHQDAIFTAISSCSYGAKSERCYYKALDLLRGMNPTAILGRNAAFTKEQIVRHFEAVLDNCAGADFECYEIKLPNVGKYTK